MDRREQGGFRLLQDGTGLARLTGSRAGDAVVVWLHLVDDRNDVWANAYDPATGWRTAEPIEHQDDDTDAPQVAVSPDGRHAMAAWTQLDETEISNVWVNHYEGAWRSEGTILDDDPSSYAHSPQVAIYQGGAAKVVWLEQFRAFTHLWTKRFVPGEIPWQQGWWAAEQIPTDTDEVTIPVLVGYDGSGATAAWREADLIGHPNVWTSRYDTVGLDWEAAVAVGRDDALLVEDIRLVADGGRNVMAIWRQVDGADNRVWANRYDVDWGWGDPESLGPDTGVPPYPEVAMDPAGNAMVVWVQWDESMSDQNIMAKRYSHLGGWQASETIDEGFGSAAHPHVAMDSNGNAMAVWRQRTDTIPYIDDIWSSHYDAAARQWAEPELLETLDGVATAPRVTMDAAGNAIAVWRQRDDTLEHYDIWANRWAPRP